MNITHLKIIEEYKSSPYPSCKRIASRHGITHQAIHYMLKTHHTPKQYIKLKTTANNKRKAFNLKTRKAVDCKTCRKATENNKYCSRKCFSIDNRLNPVEKKRRRAKSMRTYYLKTIKDRKAYMKEYNRKHYIPISKR